MIPPFIKSLPQQGPKLSFENFNWLSAEILKSHQTYIPKPICESFQIPIGAIQPGVRCETCGKIGMIKVPRTWHCPFCKVNNHLAHQGPLVEWFLVVKRKITNRECRKFLHVDTYTANRILNSMNLISEGTFKDRIYKMDFRKNK